MGSPKYTIIVNDWFIWTDEANSAREAVVFAIEKFEKWRGEIEIAYSRTPEEDRDKIYNIDEIRQEIKEIKIYSGFHESKTS